MTEESLVFVYGTLKRGFGNHHLLSESRFVGQAVTKEKYSLYEAGIPFVIENEPVSHISGEVYAVDEKTLARLDCLEGHPDWYCRKSVDVSVNTSQGGQMLEAWIYFFSKKQGVLVKSGVFRKID